MTFSLGQFNHKSRKLLNISSYDFTDLYPSKQKTRVLCDVCVLKYFAVQIHAFFLNGLYFGHPLYMVHGF